MELVKELFGIIISIMAIITFLKQFCFQKENSDIVLNSVIINETVIYNKDDMREGSYMTRYALSLLVIKDSVYNLRLYNNGKIYNNIDLPFAKEDTEFKLPTINIYTESKLEILFEDRFNNKYYKYISLIPTYYKNGVFIQPKYIQSSTKWLFLKTLYYKYKPI